MLDFLSIPNLCKNIIAHKLVDHYRNDLHLQYNEKDEMMIIIIDRSELFNRWYYNDIDSIMYLFPNFMLCIEPSPENDIVLDNDPTYIARFPSPGEFLNRYDEYVLDYVDGIDPKNILWL